MRNWVFPLLTVFGILASTSLGLIGCGDDSKGRTNDPYYDPYYDRYQYDPYMDPRSAYYRRYDPYNRNVYNNVNAVTFTGQIYVDPDRFKSFLKRSGLCGKLFYFYTTFTGIDTFGPSNCGYVNQTPIATVIINDYKLSQNGTSSGTIVLAGSHGGYALQGMPATFSKNGDSGFKAATAYRNLRFTFDGVPTAAGVNVIMHEGQNVLGEGWLVNRQAR